MNASFSEQTMNLVQSAINFRINFRTNQEPFKRSNLVGTLAKAVDDIIANGGVIALVGSSGHGKSVIAQQFVSECSEAVYFESNSFASEKSQPSELHGIAVVDEAWQFEGITNAISNFVKLKRGVVVIVACSEKEAQELAGINLKKVIHVSHWRSVDAPAQISPHTHHAQVPVPVQTMPRRSGIIRFRSPTGDVWTGVGRKPNWMKSLEADGRSCEEFRVDSTPLPRKKRSPVSKGVRS